MFGFQIVTNTNLNVLETNNCKGQCEKNLTIKCEKIFHVQVPIRCNPKLGRSEYSNYRNYSNNPRILLII